MTRSRKERQAILKTVDLYQVTSSELTPHLDTLAIVDSVLAAGVKMIQLREKGMSKKELFALAQKASLRTREVGALLIINDHVDVALAAGADGVHLGQSDLPVHAARKIGPELILGASSHNMEEALHAQGEDADYVNIGPIFPTKTKPDAPKWLSPSALGEIGPKLDISYTCMGGIGPDNIEEVMNAGAQIVAVITAVTKAPDPQAAAEFLRQQILEHRG